MPDVSTAPKPLSPAQKAMRKLGLVRDIDLALHLPLRYVDETRLQCIADVRDGEMGQVEGTVIHSGVMPGARRQFKALIEDDSDTLELRFFTFFTSHQKALTEGNQVRVRGEMRGELLDIYLDDKLVSTLTRKQLDEKASAGKVAV